MIPVNQQLQAVLATPGIVIDNAGLFLDKYHAECPAQQDQRLELIKVAAVAPKDAELTRRLSQHRAALNALGAIRWTRTTSGPLTLQLSRAGSFENASICLHPVYGFVYLPGTGVKGMARSFAESVALAAEEDIEAVFGKPPIKDEDSAAGAVVFCDAWPVKWPRLVVDIVNNHHKDYYQGGDNHAPDDFEDPNPVCFLAVDQGVEFEFAVAPRRAVSLDLRPLALAREWLDGALTLLGAGAKTNAGYGRFKPVANVALGPNFAQFSAELSLVTPAFFAGANQQREDCDLRPASVRGLLRWWWRTLHSAHLSVSELRKLEATIWGDTNNGGAISLHLDPVGQPPRPVSYNPRQIVGLDSPPDKKTTPGLLYNSYGMQASGEKASRYYLAPPASWRITLTARTRRNGLDAERALDQARLALWLLIRYGGAGAKARRGFGSFAAKIADSPADLHEAIRRAAAVRPTASAPRRPASSAIDQMQETELDLRGIDPWFALDQLGYAYQSFASSEKHRPEKVALGLPRRIHKGSQARPIPHPAGDYRRHSSPLHFHVFHDKQSYGVRIAAFASPHLPDLATSAEYLRRCVEKMAEWIAHEKDKPAPKVVSRALQPGGGPATSSISVPQPAAFKVGDRVVGILVEKSARGTWKVSVDGFLSPGPIQNTKDMPPTLLAGTTVALIVKINKAADPAFAWVKE